MGVLSPLTLKLKRRSRSLKNPNEEQIKSLQLELELERYKNDTLTSSLHQLTTMFSNLNIDSSNVKSFVPGFDASKQEETDCSGQACQKVEHKDCRYP